MPCTETDECNALVQTALSGSTNDHKEQQHENEGCNPFCSCECCGQLIFSNFQPDKNVVTKPIENQKLHSFYKNIFLSSDHFGNIWQPPKFG